MLARKTTRWTQPLAPLYRGSMAEPQRKSKAISLVRTMLVSASLATLALVAILLLFSAACVLRAFELYPRESSALFLIEVVLAVLASMTVAALYAHQHIQR
jgi:hypothetical protein